jgi:hypothetical protein
VFAVLGFLIPLGLTFRYGVMGSSSTLGDGLWISSWLFMGMNQPNPAAIAKISQLAFAWGSNIVIYAILGALGWWVVSLVRRKTAPSGAAKRR